MSFWLWTGVRVAALVFLVSGAEAQVPGLPAINFQRYFPHLVAVSEEVQNKEFLRGVQYKFLTVRDVQKHVVIVALTRREGPDRLVRLFLAEGPIDGPENTLRVTVADFSKKIGFKFEFIDLRDVKTFEAFQARVGTLGWGLQVSSK
jgi:hypothetical protein